nr:unnamed protein product [Callosobruchus analis]
MIMHVHRGNIVAIWLDETGIDRMDWPAYSPDANPIAHARDALDRRVTARHMPPHTIPDLQTALPREWDAIPQARFNILIDHWQHDVKPLQRPEEIIILTLTLFS